MPVFATRLYKGGGSAGTSKQEHSQIHYRDMKGFDKKAFVESIKQLPWDLAFLFDSIDDILDTWQKLFISAIDEHFPMRSRRVRRQRQPEWMSPEILCAVNERDRLLKRSRKTNTEDDWCRYKLARNASTCKIREAKRKFYQSALKENRHNPRRLWKHIKDLTGQNVKENAVNYIRIGEMCISGLQQIVEAFNTHFTSIAEKYSTTSDYCSSRVDNLRAFVQSKKTSTEPFAIPLASVKDITEILHAIPTNKATGTDNISAKMLNWLVQQ